MLTCTESHTGETTPIYSDIYNYSRYTALESKISILKYAAFKIVAIAHRIELKDNRTQAISKDKTII
jgi:hypothetical protein